MASTSRASTESQSVEVYEEVIRSFEAAQTKLRQRRASASEQVVVHLERSLELNERTLQSLRRAMAMASKHLDGEGTERER